MCISWTNKGVTLPCYFQSNATNTYGGGEDKHLFLMSELEWGECSSFCGQLYRRRRMYECFCGVWNFCRCREAKHFEHSYQKSQNKIFMLVYISQCCLYRACLSSYCAQVDPTLCTYIHFFFFL